MAGAGGTGRRGGSGTFGWGVKKKTRKKERGGEREAGETVHHLRVLVLPEDLAEPSVPKSCITTICNFSLRNLMLLLASVGTRHAHSTQIDIPAGKTSIYIKHFKNVNYRCNNLSLNIPHERI